MRDNFAECLTLYHFKLHYILRSYLASKNTGNFFKSYLASKKTGNIFKVLFG